MKWISPVAVAVGMRASECATCAWPVAVKILCLVFFTH